MTMESYIGNSIYILHYPSHFEENKASVSYGILKSRCEDKTYNFRHLCLTEKGSSGSPILNLLNNKVIGVHKEAEIKNIIRDYLQMRLLNIL
jgi:hypothetical protein